MKEKILMDLAIGMLGILIYAVYKSSKYVQKKVFSISTVWNENGRKWIWASIMLVLICVIINIAPSTGEALKALTGLDIANEPASFFTLGIGLTGLISGYSVETTSDNV